METVQLGPSSLWVCEGQFPWQNQGQLGRVYEGPPGDDDNYSNSHYNYFLTFVINNHEGSRGDAKKLEWNVTFVAQICMSIKCTITCEHKKRLWFSLSLLKMCAVIFFIFSQPAVTWHLGLSHPLHLYDLPLISMEFRKPQKSLWSWVV